MKRVRSRRAQWRRGCSSLIRGWRAHGGLLGGVAMIWRVWSFWIGTLNGRSTYSFSVQQLTERKLEEWIVMGKSR
ncbi:hypothetical protein BKA80DRAFT_259018 [Phyllosticta citrichinensis]